MSSFSKRWRREDEPRFSKVRDSVAPPGPLKPRILEAERKISAQMGKIDLALPRIAKRDAEIFRKVVSALQKSDVQRAAVYANELSEVRKLGKILTQAKLALEQVTLRLETIRDLGDVVTVISPAMSVVKNVGSNLSYIIPEAQGEIGEINGILTDILANSGVGGETCINSETTNEEADKILAEASVLAEEQMKKLFPELANPRLRERSEAVELG